SSQPLVRGSNADTCGRCRLRCRPALFPHAIHEQGSTGGQTPSKTVHVHPGLLGWLGLDNRSFARDGPGWALPTEQRRETPQLARPSRPHWPLKLNVTPSVAV